MLRKTLLFKKAARKMLMKLTPGIALLLIALRHMCFFLNKLDIDGYKMQLDYCICNNSRNRCDAVVKEIMYKST